jgi:hypothetical protein
MSPTQTVRLGPRDVWSWPWVIGRTVRTDRRPGLLTSRARSGGSDRGRLGVLLHDQDELGSPGAVLA